MAAIVFLGTRDPINAPWMIGLGALIVAFASATQDIVVDAYRVQSLPVDEQAAGMAGYVAAYRIGMLASGAGVIGFSAWLEAQGLSKEAVWPIAYAAAALLVLVGLFAAVCRARAAVATATRGAAVHGSPLTRLLRDRQGMPSPISWRAMRRSPSWCSSCSSSCATRWPAP